MLVLHVLADSVRESRWVMARAPAAQHGKQKKRAAGQPKIFRLLIFSKLSREKIFKKARAGYCTFGKGNVK